MLKIKNLILYFVLCVPLLVASQNNLTILVEDVDSSEGYIAVGVYTDTESFLKEGKEFTGVFAKAETGTTRIVLFDLPPQKPKQFAFKAHAGTSHSAKLRSFGQ